jgi:hypothetical protein
MGQPSAEYVIPQDGAKVVLEIKDAAGKTWSVGAMISADAMVFEPGLGIVRVPVGEVLRGGTVTGFNVIVEE